MQVQNIMTNNNDTARKYNFIITNFKIVTAVLADILIS